MIKLLRGDFARLFKMKLFWIELFTTIGYCIFLLVINYIEKAAHIGNSIVQLNWYLFSPLSAVNFLCPILSSIFIGTEYSDGIMRNKLTMGHTRNGIYLSNLILLCMANIVIVIVSSIVIALLGGLVFGYILIDHMQFVLYYMSGIVMLVSFAGLYTLLAMLIHSKTISTVTCIMTFLFGSVAESVVQRLVFAKYNKEAISDVFSFLPDNNNLNTLFEFLYEFIPFGQCFQITGNTVLHPIRLPIYSALFSAITVVCGVLAFSKKDLK